MLNKRPKKRSLVWEHFEQTPDGERAICNHCSSSLSGKSTGGTTHLKRHIQTCSRDKDPAPGNKVRKLAITDDKSWEVEVKRAVLAEIPFASSDCKKVFCSLNCPMEMDIEKSIYAYYEHEKEKLVTEFQNLSSKVSFTTDIMKEAGYFSISAHFINDDFNLVHKLIGFKKIADGSSQISIASAIQSCIFGWRLEVNIFMLTHGVGDFNVCSALNAGFRFSQACGKELIVSLFADILFDLFHLNHFMIVRFIDSNKSKLDELNQISKEQGLPPINVGLVMGMNLRRTDYSSIVRVIECTFLYKEVFRQYVPREGGQMYLSDINWEKMELLLNTCKLLDNVTKGLSSFKYPSLHLLIQYFIKIRDNISNTAISRNIAQISGSNNYMNFEEALLDTVIRSHKIQYIACVLDPRCKLYPFEYIEEIDQLEMTKGIREKIHGGLQELFGEYAKEETNHTSPLHIGTTGTTNTQDDDSFINSAHPAGHVQNASGFSMYMLQKQKMKLKTSELDEYLGERVIQGTDGSFDLLAWWKENKSRYPVLSRMARDVLAVPGSVCKVNEHITSDLQRLEDVNPQLVEAVICSKNWIISNS